MNDRRRTLEDKMLEGVLNVLNEEEFLVFDDREGAVSYVEDLIRDGDIDLSELLDLGNDEVKAQLFALVQANFYAKEIFPDDKAINESENESRYIKVSRQVETLEAENQRLRNENLKLQQQLHSIKSLLHAN